MARRHRRGRPVHGILLLDKPNGGSSNHALQRAKRLFGAAKAGHTGSLDPLATGMLPLCFGEATKLSGFLLDADKGYETTLKLGVTTNSADSDGEVTQTRAVPEDLDEAGFRQICQRFTGHLQQVPPMVSAIKIDGQRLYKLAREGKEVERPARSVTIHELEVLSFSGDSARLAVRCSKGTYIRSLVTDIGEAIGCGAHVTALRRTFVAPFQQYPMVTLETLEQMMDAVPHELTDVADGASADNDGQVNDGQVDQEPASDSRAGAAVEKSTPPPGRSSGAKSVTPAQEAMWPALDALLLPVDAGLGHLERVVVDEAGAGAFGRGQAADCVFDSTPASALTAVKLVDSADAQGRVQGDVQGDSRGDAQGDSGAAVALCRVYDKTGHLLGLGERCDTTSVSPRRVLQWG